MSMDTPSLSSTVGDSVETLLSHTYSTTQPRANSYPQIDIIEDSTGKSETRGKMDEYAKMFADRYNRMRKLLSAHNFNGSQMQLRYLSDKSSYGKNITAIGMVQDTKITNNDNRLVILDDPTGSFAFMGTDEELFPTLDILLPDQMVALEGQVSDDGEICFINDVYNPEIPNSFTPNRASRDVHAVFISDVHIGAKKFATERWLQFVDWVRQTPEISYIVHAGDLVEGIGIFPNQKQELSVTDINEQYELCGHLFSQLPDSVQIVSCTGNHDGVRVSEPQPALPDKYLQYFPDNFLCTGNPAQVQLDNSVNVTLYHGASIHDFTADIPEADEDDPHIPMKYMLKKRHLAPAFGNNTRIVPEQKDYHVIEEIPDVLHTGHVHTYGSDSYNGVQLFNTGGWVYQTSYQERMNIQPTVGRITVMNLSTGDTYEKQFN